MVSLYSHLSQYIIPNHFHYLNSTILKTKALLEFGELGKAGSLLAQLLTDPELPRLPAGQDILRGLQVPSDSGDSGGSGEKKDSKGGSKGSGESSAQVETVSSVGYSAHLSPYHGSNSRFIKLLLDPTLGNIESALSSLFGSYLWACVSPLKVEFLLRVASYTDPLSFTSPAEALDNASSKGGGNAGKKGAGKGGVLLTNLDEYLTPAAALVLKNECLTASQTILLNNLGHLDGDTSDPLSHIATTAPAPSDSDYIPNNPNNANNPEEDLTPPAPARSEEKVFLLSQLYSDLALVAQLSGNASVSLGWNQRALQLLYSHSRSLVSENNHNNNNNVTFRNSESATNSNTLQISVDLTATTTFGGIGESKQTVLSNNSGGHWRTQIDPRLWLLLRARRSALLLGQG